MTARVLRLGVLALVLVAALAGVATAQTQSPPSTSTTLPDPPFTTTSIPDPPFTTTSIPDPPFQVTGIANLNGMLGVAGVAILSGAGLVWVGRHRRRVLK